jgi:hypothetical protein
MYSEPLFLSGAYGYCKDAAHWLALGSERPKICLRHNCKFVPMPSTPPFPPRHRTPCLQRSSTTFASSPSTPLPHNPASNTVPPFLLPTPHGSRRPTPLVRANSKPLPLHVAHGVRTTTLLEGHLLYIGINQDFPVRSPCLPVVLDLPPLFLLLP